jgi:uncharacterized membrane protein YphA (DoxX/SURF4 family)
MRGSEKDRSEKRANAVRYGVGVIFVFAGVGKLSLSWLIPLVRPGSPDFAAVLAAIGMPWPAAMSVAVCLVEILGGLALLGNRLVPVAGAALALDMIGALATLSVPATFLGRRVVLGGLSLGDEIWRVPLEIALLAASMFLAHLGWRRSRTLRYT